MQRADHDGDRDEKQDSEAAAVEVRPRPACPLCAGRGWFLVASTTNRVLVRFHCSCTLPPTPDDAPF